MGKKAVLMSMLAIALIALPGWADHTGLFRPDPGAGNPCVLLNKMQSSGVADVRQIFRKAVDQMGGGFAGEASQSGSLLWTRWEVTVKTSVEDFELQSFDCEGNRYRIGMDYHTDITVCWFGCATFHFLGNVAVSFSPQVDMSGSPQQAKVFNLYVNSLSINNLPEILDDLGVTDWVEAVVRDILNDWLDGRVFRQPVRDFTGNQAGVVVFAKLEGSSGALPIFGVQKRLGDSFTFRVTDTRSDGGQRFCFVRFRITQDGQWTTSSNPYTLTLDQPITIAVAEYRRC